MDLSVVICTYNPRHDYLARVLDALRTQTLPKERWELLIIDNASRIPVRTDWDLSWHPHGRIVEEPNPGLTQARLRGLKETHAPVVLFSDDDTVLSPDYLAEGLKAFEQSERLGVTGGRSIPEYEKSLPPWFDAGLAPMGCRDLGDQSRRAEWTSDSKRCYPEAAPIGAGMVLRREVLALWAELISHDPKRRALGRTGNALSSGEDNDIVLVALSNGWAVSYEPGLRLTHLIPARRLEAGYLERLAFAASRDWMRVLALHGVNPWPSIPGWTLPLRKMKAWVTHKAWAGPAERIRWSGACGHFEGRVA